jgi:predicted transcriptional regulator
MPRPATEHPTPAELEVLKALWDRGPSTVRDVLDEFRAQGRRRAYTSVMSLMNVMADKKLLRRRPQGRAYVYAARTPREATLGQMVGDLWQRAFEGSASTLVTRLLEEARPSDDELLEIRKVIAQYQSEQGGGP